MTDLEAFLPKILPFAPGCPEPTAFDHLRRAASDFCEETKLWRFDDSFDLGDEPNLICTPQGAEIHQIERCDFNGCPLQPRSLDWLDEHLPAWRSVEHMATGTPSYFTQLCPDTVRVVPHQLGRVHLWLRLKPAEDATQLPDFMATQHATMISWGALATILMLPNQTFTDPNRATYFQARFDQMLGRKSRLQSSGQQRAPVRTKAQFF